MPSKYGPYGRRSSSGPLEGVTFGGREVLPTAVAGEDRGVGLAEHVLADRRLDRLFDFLRGRPDVLEEDGVARSVVAERVGFEVEVHGSGKTVGNDERRGRQVVHLDVGGDATLEVAVAREHCGDRQVVVVDRLGYGFGQRPGVTDAGGAAVTAEVVAELLEVRPQAGLLVVVGDDLRTGRHIGLDPRLGAQALLDGIACEKRGTEHDGRVGRVGAGRDAGNDDGTVIEHELAGIGLDDHRLARTAFCAVGSRQNVDGSVVSEGQGSRIGGGEGLFDGLVELGVLGRKVLFHVVVDVLAERSLGIRQQDPVLRALRTCDRGNNGSKIELDVLGEDGLFVGVVPQTLFLGVRLDERELLVAAAGQAQVVDRFAVDREDRCGGTEFGAHVAQGCAVRERNLGDTLAVELDELTDDTVLTQHLGGRQHDVGCGDSGLDLAGEFEADDAGDEHGDRLAEHRGLGSMRRRPSRARRGR